MTTITYVSSGRNPNHEPTCESCINREPSNYFPGWGWCKLRNLVRVSPTGGCDDHIRMKSINVEVTPKKV